MTVTHTTPKVVRFSSARLKERASFFRENPGKVLGLSWGWQALDDGTGGIDDYDTIAVVGDTGAGKSQFAANVAINLISQGKRVVYLAMEMDQYAMGFRFASLLSGVGHKAIKRGRFWNGTAWQATTGDMYEQFFSALDLLPTLSLGLTFGSLTSGEIHEMIQGLKSQNNRPDLVIVDHVGLLADHGSGTTERLANAIKALRQTTLQLAVPIMVLSQLKREVKTREDKRPNLGDSSDTSETDKAPLIWLGLYRDSYYTNPGQTVLQKDTTEVICRKNREGAPFTAMMDYDVPTGRLTEQEPETVDLWVPQEAA